MGIIRKKLFLTGFKTRTESFLLKSSGSDFSGQYFVESIAVWALALNCIKVNSTKIKLKKCLLFIQKIIIQIYVIIKHDWYILTFVFICILLLKGIIQYILKQKTDYKTTIAVYNLFFS